VRGILYPAAACSDDKMDGMLPSLAILWLSGKVDFESPTTQLLTRAGFFLMQTWYLVVLYYIYRRIIEKKDTTAILVDGLDQMGRPDPKAPKVRSSVIEYDLEQLKAVAKNGVVSLCMSLFICYKWGPRPMFLQATLTPLQLFKNNLVSAHIQGKELPRPFPVPEDPMKKLMQSFQPEEETPKPKKKTDTRQAAIDALNKSKAKTK